MIACSQELEEDASGAQLGDTATKDSGSTDAARQGPQKVRQTAAAAAPSSKPAVLGTPFAKAAPGKDKDKLSVKDRTKHQRLAGQTGLDHRTWRSDEEMRLRQQFDS